MSRANYQWRPLQAGRPIRASYYHAETMTMLERWHICDDDGVMSPFFGSEAEALGWYADRKAKPQPPP
jgi:hypothetical protein